MSSNEYMNNYMKKRYKERRDFAIDLLGGKCVKCGSDNRDELEFDHINPEEKEIDIADAILWAKERFLKELDKCQLLCYTCHKDKHKEIWIETKCPNCGKIFLKEDWAFKNKKHVFCSRSCGAKYNYENGNLPQLPPKDNNHGINMYRRGCRCDICKSANTEKARKLRNKKKNMGL